MTHGELVSMAAQKLKKWRCLPICTEMMALTATGEIPDAIGWRAWESILFECKASRADFLKDRDKPFRVCPESGVGDWRFFLTNPGVIHSADELPAGWGCYEVIEGKIVHKYGKRYANALPIPLHGNKKEEIIIMRSWIRRFVEDGKMENDTETEKSEKCCGNCAKGFERHSNKDYVQCIEWGELRYKKLFCTHHQRKEEAK